MTLRGAPGFAFRCVTCRSASPAALTVAAAARRWEIRGVETEPENELGIWCRACGATRFEVEDASARMDGTYRVRRCAVCGERLLALERFLARTDGSRVRAKYPPELRPFPPFSERRGGRRPRKERPRPGTSASE